jgi:hypothetical protein
MYVVAVTAVSVAMAWLYLRTDGSLPLVMLMHSAINNTAGIVSSPAVAGANMFTLAPLLIASLTTGLLWACAAYFLVRMRGATLEHDRALDSAGRTDGTGNRDSAADMDREEWP